MSAEDRNTWTVAAE